MNAIVPPAGLCTKSTAKRVVTTLLALKPRTWYISHHTILPYSTVLLLEVFYFSRMVVRVDAAQNITVLCIQNRCASSDTKTNASAREDLTAMLILDLLITCRNDLSIVS